MKKVDNSKIQDNFEEINDYCEECKKEDKSVSQNLILTGFKICNSCKLSKTIFPI
jgi:formate-dependent nitrite reductase cytochrome c552 subunit|tara:strand:- start:305 stop:469 length:165 start_codon:yes stop_codon:yes gene_type:complete